MKIFKFPNHVNERAARIVAATVAILLMSAWVFQLAWLLPFIAGGFVLRWCFGPRYSPLARLAVLLAPWMAGIKLVPGPPKRLAQGIGATLLLASSLLVFVNQTTIGWTLAVTVALFATLEATLGFCMGCWLYGKLIRFGLIAADRCEDCRPSP